MKGLIRVTYVDFKSGPYPAVGQRVVFFTFIYFTPENINLLCLLTFSVCVCVGGGGGELIRIFNGRSVSQTDVPSVYITVRSILFQKIY